MITDYNSLQAAILDEIANTGLAHKVGQWIRFAEDRHVREIKIRPMEERYDTPGGISTRYIPLPPDYESMRSLRLWVNGIPMTPQKRSPEQVVALYRPGTGAPKYFAVHENLEFDVTPSSGIKAEILYYKRLPALSTSNPTNALLTKASDIYFYSSLVYAAPYIGDMEKGRTWDSFYVQLRDQLLLADRSGIVSGESTASLVSLNTP